MACCALLTTNTCNYSFRLSRHRRTDPVLLTHCRHPHLPHCIKPLSLHASIQLFSLISYTLLYCVSLVNWMLRSDYWSRRIQGTAAVIQPARGSPNHHLTAPFSHSGGVLLCLPCSISWLEVWPLRR
ncbi:hypothetical protein P152DRAFT_178750 [Eremomyces bilateralis CBS 781.70]|uniref:Uncharacterized protein n=1 Tax=Eremomyces bilateralis CBS 781.70 TaxID=1392243 RepID=A0A6G1FSY0_9PEZI|nr:uncharacterized protein P152DRAFT_178750 [Eremomyces bilateralis CBS 781.70]KAF1808975.1 hypothetical protein P152DRAFT_178750 [Eremomyces bilateralis CBS 781.70]